MTLDNIVKKIIIGLFVIGTTVFGENQLKNNYHQEFDNNGKVIAQYNDTNEISYGYDQFGNLESKEHIQYDTEENLIKITYEKFQDNSVSYKEVETFTKNGSIKTYDEGNDGTFEKVVIEEDKGNFIEQTTHENGYQSIIEKFD